MTSQLPTPGVLYINPAGGCNLHCKHCWVNEGSFTGELLALEQWAELLSQAKELGCGYVKLTGGEPLLYEHIVPLYRFIAEGFPKVVIETNGTLQPAGLWDALLERKPFHLSVSLDSAEPDVHDEFRGETGAWEKTVSFARKLVEHGITNQVIMSVPDTKRKPVENMIRLVQDLGVHTLKINFITPSGRGKSNNFFDNSSIQETLDFFSWIDSETPVWVRPSIPAALLPVNRLPDLGYCPVRNLMGVLPDGTFSLCGVAFSRKEMAWGKFPETSVKEAWKNSPVYRLIRSSVPDNLEGICRRCIHRDSCIGRCVANNMETGGTITSPDILCQRAFDAGLFPETRLINR
ncbi:MAG: radical SAM protein [Candidatus Aegiribacteria sp.]|nr:radical SAM protein [Candidatus Aegiribacteria sp.]